MANPSYTSDTNHTNKKRRLLFFVVLSSALLIGINFFTIKILSDVRAYVNGESEYSKGQKDASFFLTAYIDLQDEQYWEQFNKSIQVPIGDKIARVALQNGSADSVVAHGFLQARNHPDDIKGLIWMFRIFGNTWFMKDAIVLWQDADSLNAQLLAFGNTTHSNMAQRALSLAEKKESVRVINTLSSALSGKEHEFSNVLGSRSRDISRILVIVNIVCILVILGNLAFYVITMMNKLDESNKELEEKNTELSNTSKELDTFVYSLSHDLRAPITSIKGLIYIALREPNKEVLLDYFTTIDDVISKQDAFIKEIIDFFRNKRSSVVVKELSLVAVTDDVINNNRFIPQAQAMQITKEIDTDIILCDELRFKMILNNLVSNAIKYSDDKKPQRWMAIRTRTLGNNVHIEVEDNGIGIEKEYFEKIFNMFFVTCNDNRGTGLGLYILKQNVEKLKGEILVCSEVGIGTKITIILPLAQQLT